MFDNETLLFKYNVDTEGNPISVKVDREQKQVGINGTIQMEFIPDEFNRVNMLGDNNQQMYEVFNRDEITSNTYYVDYSSGTIYYDKSQFGKVKLYNYYSRGFQMIGASRIYDETSVNGNLVTKTLQDIINVGKEYIEILGDVIKTKAELEIMINESTQLKSDLYNLNQEVLETNAQLIQTNQDSVRLNTILENTIANSQESINKINATGNKSLVIGASQFINNEYTWTHNMNSKELTVVMYDSLTDEPLMLNCKLIDRNNILIRNSGEHPNIKVVLSASYYSGNALFGTNTEEFADDSIQPNSKKVRLRDANGIVENPVTDSDAVFMSDGAIKLTKKISDMDNNINSNLNLINSIIREFKYNIYDKRSFIVDSDITKIKYMINNNIPCRVAILGDSNEAGVGYRFNGSSLGYAEMGDIQKPTHHEMYCMELLKNSPFFIKPSVELGGGECFYSANSKITGIADASNMTEWDRYFMAYGLLQFPTKEITLNFKHLLTNRKSKMYVIYGQRKANGAGTFDVISNGETKFCHTYKDDKIFGGSGENPITAPQEGFSLYWREINIPTDTNNFTVVINNLRQGLGSASTTGNLNIIGFYYGDIFEFRNFSVRTTTLEDNSNANQSKGVTTSGRINQAITYGANVYFMGWGSNDANISGYPLESFLAEYLRRYNSLKTNDPNCIVILNNDAEDRKNVEYYDALKKVCIDNNISFLDFRSVLNNYPRSEVMYDAYSHVNEKGTRVLFEHLSKVL